MNTPMPAAFADHFSAAAAQYASARPGYPADLFAWIAGIAPAQARVWEPACGSGQASRDLALYFDQVFATDPSAAQIAEATHAGNVAPANVAFVVQPGERCSLADASVDAVCVAQALHWFDRQVFFEECARVLKPGGVLVAWGYQDIEPSASLRAAVDAFRDDIDGYWPPQRAFIDAAYADFAWPFARLQAPAFELGADWPLPRLLEYFSSFSAVKGYREATGIDPVARHAPAIAAAWGDGDALHSLRWPMFVHARRKEA